MNASAKFFFDPQCQGQNTPFYIYKKGVEFLALGNPHTPYKCRSSLLALTKEGAR